MKRIPKITVQGWTAEGPAYSIHQQLEGRRNRHARRAGAEPVELVGDHAAPQASQPAGALVWALGDDERWAFNRGYVYQLEVLVDGESRILHVDARDDYVLHDFVDGVQLYDRRPLTDTELAELLADGAGVDSEPEAGDEEEE